MKNLPNKKEKLFVLLEFSKKTNRLVIESESAIWFYSFNEISYFQVNIQLSFVVFFIENKRIWLQYAPSEKLDFLKFLQNQNYKLVSEYNYVKIDECKYIAEETSTLVLKNGYKLKNIFNTKTIMELFSLPLLKIKKTHQKELHERYSINSGR
ncbi:MAG: hypothetical protein K9H61_00440 [Bacteroidia bacterium]|nr:hypothetical protein [Bacteroidia bacterium]MCF8428168.1 hypothetical protein [Bacteroidia bacterium]MCF8445432.1 hypothetical protein [Bacteroidia bacterium]